eukprot:Partr_v1_DN22292_c0_g1_i1_m59407 putative NA
MSFANHLFDSSLIGGDGSINGTGVFQFPSGDCSYHGEIVDGQFHGDGQLIFKDGSRYVATWSRGVVISGHLQFADGLKYEPSDWTYLQAPDRRFHRELQDNKVSPAGYHIS